MRRRVVLLAVVLAALADACVGAADITIPDFELYTHGYMSSGRFQLSTYGNIEIGIGGGYKFGGQILLGFQNSDLAALSALSTSSIYFKGASITVRDVFDLPIDLSYFTGVGDTFGDGSIFPDLFGTAPIATRMEGYLYFPTGPQYQGIYTLAGTGLSLSTDIRDLKWLKSTLYVYQDANLGAGLYSSDYRVVLNFDRFKMDSFVGASFPYSSYGLYRGGLLLYYDTGSVGQFFTQIGIPRYDPYSDALNIGLFYLLFEPRVDFGNFAIIPTLFWHPSSYNDQSTGQVPTVDINVNFRVGDPNRSTVTGGAEAALGYTTTTATQFSAGVSPYLNLVAAGVLWSFKVNVHLYPFNLATIADGFVGVQAQF